MLLRDTVTERTGGLHSGQILQLRLWPFVAAPHLLRHETTPDLKAKKVEFRMELNPDLEDPVDFDERLKALDVSVKTMLGKDWTITVFADGRQIYGKRAPKKPTKKKPNATKRPKPRTRPRGR